MTLRRSRFAPAASSVFDTWFSAELTWLGGQVAAAVGPSFQGLVLGGGYGRGEGGVRIVAGEERAYNDIDLFLFTTSPSRASRRALDRLSLEAHGRFGVDVDFSRAFDAEEVRRWRPSLMWHELARGHVVIAGPADLIESRCPAGVLRAPARSEALRLLLNRGAGLLWAWRVVRGLEVAPDPDFVRRNIQKCALACGDAVLIAHERFGSFSGRDRRLAEILSPDGAARDARLEAYAAARRFKLEPDVIALENVSETQLRGMAGMWAAAVLEVEAAASDRRWTSIDEYAAWTGRREPVVDTVSHLLHDLAANARLGRMAWFHPREGLHRRLPALLGLTGATTDSRWAAASSDWLSLWRRAC